MKATREYHFKEVKSDDPYILDYLYDEKIKIKIPSLTEKNSLFLEAVVRLDSNYGNDAQPYPCGKNFLNVLEDNTNFSQRPSNDNYVGSTSFWFESMQKNSKSCSNELDFNICLRGALHNINLTNSTRSSKESINSVADKLYDNCQSVDELKALLRETFSKDNPHHIMSILTKPTEDGGKNKLSLASKFCAYATEYLFNDIDLKPFYPKYDGVVSSNLHYYFYHYAGTYLKNIPDDYRKILNRNFKVNLNLKNDDRFNDYMSIYEAYSWCIARILEQLETNGIVLKASELDHIIWYCKK